MSLKVEKTGYGDARRIVTENGELVGMAIKYTQNLWAAHSVTDKKLTPPIYKTPNAVKKFFEEPKC